MKIIRRIGRLLFSGLWGCYSRRRRASDRRHSGKGRLVCLLCRIEEARLLARGVVARVWCYFHALKKFRIAAVEW